MNLTVKVFGPQARLVGREEVALTLDEPATCRDVRRALAATEPALASSLDASRFAVNHEYVKDDHRVAADDEVALIGMISGG